MIPFIKLPKIIDLLSRLYLNLLSSISYVYFMAIMTFLTQTLLRSSVVSEECILNTSSFISSTISSFHFHALPFFLVFPFLGYLISSTPPHFILILLLLGNSLFPLLYYNSCAFFIDSTVSSAYASDHIFLSLLLLLFIYITLLRVRP